MGNKQPNPLGLLMALSLMGAAHEASREAGEETLEEIFGVGKKPTPDDDDLAFSPVANNPKELASFNEMKETIAGLTADDVDSFIVLVRRKSDTTEPCKDCGIVHASGSSVLASVNGKPKILLAMVDQLIDSIEERTHPGGFNPFDHLFNPRRPGF